MVFLSVGNLKQPFARMIRAVEEAAAAWPGEEILAQAGSAADMGLRGAAVVTVLPPEDYAAAMERADLVILHCGAGSLAHAFGAGHLPLVMARRPEFGESVEDQRELAGTLAEEGRILLFETAEDLVRLAPQARAGRRRPKAVAEALPIVGLVGEAIRELLGEPER